MWSSFSSLKEELKKRAHAKGFGSRVEATLIMEGFQRVAASIWDETVARDMKALYVKNGVLTIAVLHSVIAQELGLRKVVVLAELARQFGKDKVKDIRIIQ